MKKKVRRFGLDFRITVTLFVVQLIVFAALFLLIGNMVPSESKGRLVLFFLAGMAFLTVWVYLVVHNLMLPLKRVEKAAEKLEHIDLGAADEVADLVTSPDEVGTIATAVVDMSASLRNATADVARILRELADENLAVDVKQNSQYYTGDFSELADSLTTIKDKLSGVISDIYVQSAPLD